jgi:hypothetical protein
LQNASLQEERFEYLDDQLEGKAEHIDFDLSYKLGWRKGGPVRIVIARAKYRVLNEDGSATLVTTWVPRSSAMACRCSARSSASSARASASTAAR